MLPLVIRVHLALLTLPDRVASALRRQERGQTTAEYALVLLGAAAVALLVLAWATNTEKVGRVLNAVLDRVLEQVQ